MIIIASNLLEKDQALQLLKIGPQYEQIVIKTEKAATKLCFKHAVELGSEEIAQYQKTLQEEENEFQAEFLNQLEAMHDSDD